MTRGQIALAVLLAVQAAALVLCRSGLLGQDTGPRNLLPELDPAAATRIELTAGEETLVLEREGEGWVVGQGGYPADAQRVQKLIGDLAALRVRRPVVETERYHEAFGVTGEAPEARVRIWAGAEDPAAELLVGTSSGFRSTHVRLAGEDSVWEVGGIAAHDLEPTRSAWIDRDLVDVEPASVERLTVTNARGSFEIARSEGGWRLVAPAERAGAALDPDAVDTLVRDATSLRLSDVAGRTGEADFGLDDPAARVRLVAGPEGARETIEIVIGGSVAGDEGQRHAARAGSPWVGLVWDSAVDPLAGATLDDLLAAPSES